MTRKSIFITGAASGMGLATARLFAARGWFVGGYDIDEERLKTLELELGPEGGTVGRLDVADRPSFEAAMTEFSVATGGRLDLLFNNAGIARGGPYEKMAFQDILKVLDVNLKGVLIGIHVGAELLKATPGSLCFNTSSASALFGLPNMAIYAATKAAVKTLTEALAVEFMPYGVRVSDAIPGLVDTAFIPRRVVETADTGGMFRIVSADEVAQTVWDAYHGDKVHWPIPGELSELQALAGSDPQKVKALVASRSGPYSWMNRVM